MKSPLCSMLCIPTLSLAWLLPTTSDAAGVAVGSSSLIGLLDYSDTFTGTDSGGKPDRPYIPAVQPAAAYLVENTYGNPQISFDKGEGFSFASDNEALGRPGFVPGVPAFPGGSNTSGAGSDTGFSQTGGNLDYGLPYAGLRLEYTVQVDALQVGDRIDISSGATRGIFAPQSLSVFFRGDGSGNASLFNGVTDTPIQATFPAFNTGITGASQWYNYAVRFDSLDQEIELFVNQASVGVIDLNTFAGGIYTNFSNQFVGAGAGLAAGENRTWTDNFQVGRPVPEPTTAMLALGGLALSGLRRRRSR